MIFLKRIFFLSIFTLSFVFSFLLFPVPTAHAQGLSLGIEPPILQIEATPAASIEAPITIANEGDETVTLRVLLRPFTAAKSEDGIVEFLPEGKIDGPDPLLFQKVQVLDSDRVIQSITLAPKQQKTLSLHIGIPKDQPLADYYFSVVFIADTQQFTDQSASTATGGIATNVLLSVGPKGKPQGFLEEFSVPFFLDRGPVPFTVRITNTGERVIAPQGQILITNMFGQTIGKVDLLPVNILVNTTRAIPDSLQAPVATPSATLEQTRANLPRTNGTVPVAFWPEEFLLGYYTATLTVAVSDTGPILTKAVHFIAIPLHLIIGALVTISILLLIYTRVRKKLR